MPRMTQSSTARGRNQSAPSLLSEYSSIAGAAIVHRRSEIALRAAKVKAELASRSKSEFLANMNHELRTPLNAIIGFSEMLAEFQNYKLAPEQITEYAGYIKTSSVNLLDLINSILDISAIDSGRLELDFADVELLDIFYECCERARARAQDANLQFEVEIGAEQIPVHADPRRLRQALGNVLDNALKFTSLDGVVTASISASHKWAVIAICDKGVGMTREEIELAFRPFLQADAGLNRKFEGAGLGLPIAKGVIELHGGRLEIMSSVGEGTVVQLYLPLIDSSFNSVEGVDV